MVDYIAEIQERLVEKTTSYKPQPKIDECLDPYYYFWNILFKTPKYISWRVFSCL